MLSETHKIVPIMSAGNLDTAATTVSDSINMKNYHKATLVFMMGTLGTDTCDLVIWSGASNGALSSALTVKYAWSTAAAAGVGADVLGAWTSAATIACTYTTKSNFMLVVEVDAKNMDLANDESWLTAVFTDTTDDATGLVSAVAILEPRYTSNVSVTSLT